MKLAVDSLVLHSGVIESDEADSVPGRGIFEHRIVDKETGDVVIERIFDNVVEATLYLAALRPQLEAGDLPPMTAEEEEKLISKWSESIQAFEAAGMLAELFQSEITPNRIDNILKRPHSKRMDLFVGNLRRLMADVQG